MTGRLGYTWGPALLYAKGGYAWRDGNNIGVTAAGVPQAFTASGNRKDGYTVGGGLEYMFAPNWSAKAEYQYYNFGNTTLTTGPADIVGTRFRNDIVEGPGGKQILAEDPSGNVIELFEPQH